MVCRRIYNHRHLVTTLKNLITSIFKLHPLAADICRDFFLADAPALLLLLDRKINFLKILNKQQASHSSSEFYKIKYLC